MVIGDDEMGTGSGRHSFLAKGLRQTRIALSLAGPSCASTQSYHISKQLTGAVVRCNTKGSSALIQRKHKASVDEKRKGQKSYWGGFHSDVTLTPEPALNPAKIGARASLASMLSGSEPKCLP
ncbi:hypothetical protein [Bradyrhizobium sp. Ash2021]|uniref:hypothetical protein n=1 Tax=Bradyrhizobium sp. Ash2021 TaxID=2954771 RepID=UPI0028150417|nr:hypothetical protein [Bradyrhizobium sp. Ash2021]WMT75785.1 hypothetical protein NL528_05065 [Bradyrhizobium sp. Ash2021]